MKKLVCILLAYMCCLSVYAQTPDALRYQASIQSESGEQLANETLTFRVSVLLGQNRVRVYSEFHEISTDEFGIVNFSIGMGNAISGIFSSIDWTAGAYFLRIEMDDNGGADFRILSEVQLLSVPYALHAKSVDNTDDADANPENELQELILEGDQLSISNGNTITLPSSADTDPLNELQELSIDGQQLSLSNGNTIEIPVGDDADADPGNELQLISLVGNELSISQGNSVLLTDSDNQILSLIGNELSISNGNSITLEMPGDNIIPDPSQPVSIKFRGSTLYVHPLDNSVDSNMGSFIASGATSDSDGQSNTAALVAANGTTPTAAKICDDLNDFGFEDWYLPSRAELDAVFKQNYLIDNYDLDAYWTSTETAANKSYVINFASGGLSDDTKNQSRNCRCIRKE